jgi:hypothetical protein
MPAVNPFPGIYADLQQESLDVQAAFGNAEVELVGAAAATTYFLEIVFDSTAGHILRISDNAQVSTLSDAEQLRLYPQLGGLFNLAMRNLLNP